MMAAKIISPVIDSSYTSGYNWCIEQVKSSQYMDLAHSLDIDKAIGFLRQKDFNQVSQSLHLAAYLTLEQPASPVHGNFWSQANVHLLTNC